MRPYMPIQSCFANHTQTHSVPDQTHRQVRPIGHFEPSTDVRINL